MLRADTRMTQHTQTVQVPPHGVTSHKCTPGGGEQGHAHALPPTRRHTRCSVHTHVCSGQEGKLVSGAQAVLASARMCSSQCAHTCGAPARAHVRCAHVCFFRQTHSRALGRCTYTVRRRMCAHSVPTHACVCRWVLPVLIQRRIVFLLSFLTPPSSALCRDGRSRVCLFLSSWGRTTQRYPHAAPLWTVTHVLRKVEIPPRHEGCLQDRGAESSQASGP